MSWTLSLTLTITTPNPNPYPNLKPSPKLYDLHYRNVCFIPKREVSHVTLHTGIHTHGHITCIHSTCTIGNEIREKIKLAK